MGETLDRTTPESDFGRGVWLDGRSTLIPEHGDPRLVASAAWPDPDRMELDLSFYTSPFRYTIAFDFSEPDRLSLATRTNVSFGPTDLGVMVAKRAG